MAQNDKWSYSFEWTQPYVSMEHFWSSKNSKIDDELVLVDLVDEQVDKMLTYPDADAILNKIRRQHD